jgi:hypothetical protein
MDYTLPDCAVGMLFLVFLAVVFSFLKGNRQQNKSVHKIEKVTVNEESVPFTLEGTGTIRLKSCPKEGDTITVIYHT